MKNIYYLFSVILLTGLVACEPAVDDKIDIGSAPTASFEIEAGDTPNDFTLRNTTTGGFITHWDLGVNGSAQGEIVDVKFPNKGDYDITMTTFNQGGSGSATKTLTVTQDDASECQGTLELLTGCDEKTWKIAPEAGAIHIGPNLEETWWGNSEADVADRACHFNDEYIFRVNGEFEYDNKGDFWADTDGDGNITPSDLGLEPGCQSSSDWPEKYQAWGSNIHAFTATDSGITIAGEGAWIGLYKIGTSTEVVTPQSSVSYIISEISDSRMVIYADHGGAAWRITLVSE